MLFMGQGSKFDSALSTRGGRSNFVTQNDILNKDLLAKEILKEMEDEEIKYSKDKIIFAARLDNNRKIFLERGDSKSGAQHIIERHGDDFAKAFSDLNVTKANLESYLSDVISKGKLVSSFRRDTNGKEGYRSVYYYKGHRTVVVSIAGNGYIVESRPGSIYGGK